MVVKIKRFFKRSFSLVELIVVIAIVAILSVASYMTVTKWLGESRDTNRLSSLKKMHQSLEYSLARNPDVPKPDGELSTGTIGDTEFIYVGDYGSGVVNKLGNVSEAPRDPSTEDYYRYGVNEEQTKYQVAVVLENGQERVGYLSNQVYAAEKITKIRGNYADSDMYIFSGNKVFLRPSLIFLEEGVIKNLTGAVFSANNSPNLAYKLFSSDIQKNESSIIVAKRILDRQAVNSLEVNFSGKELSTATGFVTTFSGIVGNPDDMISIAQNIKKNNEDINLAEEEKIKQEAENSLNMTPFSKSTEYEMCGDTLHGESEEFYTEDEVPEGQICPDPKTFTCNDGSWTGSVDKVASGYDYKECSIYLPECQAGGTVPCEVY